MPKDTAQKRLQSTRRKFFDQGKGLGVIKPDKPGPDAYVSQYSLEAARVYSLKPKQRVFYQLKPHPLMGSPVAGGLCLIDRRSKRGKVPS